MQQPQPNHPCNGHASTSPLAPHNERPLAAFLQVDFWSVPVSTDVDLSQAPNDTPARKEKTMKCTKGGSGFMCVEG
jgi:hypothetical protein